MNQESTELLLQIERAPAHERVAILRTHGDEALSQLVEKAAAQTWKDAKQALTVTQIVLDLATEHGTPADRARARWARARALASGGRFEEAAATCRIGIDEAKQHDLSVHVGRLQLVLMQALGELGRLDEAIREGHDARETFLAAGDGALAARADINSGIVHLRRDEPATALQCLDRAKPWFADEPLILGHLENSRGEALLALNNFAGAEQAYRRALSAFQTGGATLVAAIAEGNLAELATRQGRLQRSMFHFERARRYLEKDAAPGQLARLLAEQADALEVLGMPAEAITEYEAALPELDRCGLALEAARARSGMGLALMRLGRLAQAETSLAAAAKSFDELGHATARARVDLIRAEIAAANGQVAEARRIVMRALSTLHERPMESAIVRLLLSRLAMELGELNIAEAELSMGLAAARQLDLAPLLADALHSRGQLRLRQNRPDDAVTDFAEAVANIERVRDTLQADRFRAAFLGNRQQMYESLASAHLDSGASDAVAKSFATAELAKSRVLLEQMQKSHVESEDAASDLHDSDERGVLADLERQRAQLSALYSRVGDQRPGAAGIEASRSLIQEIRAFERTIDGLERRLVATQGAGGLFAPTIDLAAVQQSLDPHTALLEFFIANEELLAFVVRCDRASVVRKLANAQDLVSFVQRLQFQMNRALRPGAMKGDRAETLLGDAKRELGALYQVLIKPLQSLIEDASRLVIVPHGVLHLTPFAALWDGERYFVESHQIGVSPSASLWAQIRTTNGAARSNEGNRIVVGVADEFAPHIEAEAREVAELLGCSPDCTLVGSRGTIENVRRAVRDADILHLACHGQFVSDSPMGSGLRLADGWLTLHDIYKLRFNSQPKVVTLSGCETGVNLVNAGDELMGLLRGFLAAGAGSVLASLWRVEDRVTREFMSSFYGSLHTVESPEPAASLRSAQLALLRSDGHWRHPAFWAPFMMAGGY